MPSNRASRLAGQSAEHIHLTARPEIHDAHLATVARQSTPPSLSKGGLLSAEEPCNGAKIKHPLDDRKLRKEYRRSVGTILDAEVRAAEQRETLSDFQRIHRLLVALQ